MKKYYIIFATSLCISLTLNAQTSLSLTSVPTSVDVGNDLSVTLTYTNPNAGKLAVQLQVRDSVGAYVSDLSIYKDVEAGTNVSKTISVAIPSFTEISDSLVSGNKHVVIIQLLETGFSILKTEIRDITLGGTSTVSPSISVEDGIIPDIIKLGEELSVAYTYTSPEPAITAVVIQQLNADGGYVSGVLYAENEVSSGTDIKVTRTVTIPTTHSDDPTLVVAASSSLPVGHKYVMFVVLVTQVSQELKV